MVSSGISNHMAVSRPADVMAMGNVKNPAGDFGAIMARSGNTGLSDFRNPVAGSGMNTERTLNRLAVAVTGNGGDSRVQQPSETTKTSDSVKTSSVKKDADTVKKVESKVNDAVRKITDKIKEELNVTDEEIQNALEALGINIMDLMDEGNLADFIVELTGMESSVELLVSADLQGAMEEISAFLEDVLADLAKEFGVSTEEMEQMISDAMKDSVLDEGAADNTDNVDALQHPEKHKDPAEDMNAQKNAVEEENEVANQDLRKNTEPEETDKGVNENAPNGKVMKVESSSGADHKSMDMTGNQNNDFAGTMMNQLVEAVTEALEVNEVSAPVNPVEIINQIVEAARVTLNQETTTMEMMLNPENLGKVNLNISVKEGVVTASLVAQNEAVKQAIENQIVILKENLNQQGLKVEAVEVTVESHAFEDGAT
ncbi:MAG: flagellar hook-length control protein FliK, partial [Lachnospiraceae bacterium]